MSNIIKIGEAKIWTALWQRLFPNHCKAFLVPVSDLLGTLGEMGIIEIDGKGNIKGQYDPKDDQMIRSYLAIDPDLVLEPGKGEKLLVVGTVKETNGKETVYRDIVEGEKDGNGATLVYTTGVTLNDSGVYDFTAPCPNNCDPNSPLNH